MPPNKALQPPRLSLDVGPQECAKFRAPFFEGNELVDWTSARSS